MRRIYKIECRYNRKTELSKFSQLLLGEWRIWRRYKKIKDAETALATLSKKANGYEFRLVIGE